MLLELGELTVLYINIRSTVVKAGSLSSLNIA